MFWIGVVVVEKVNMKGCERIFRGVLKMTPVIFTISVLLMVKGGADYECHFRFVLEVY